MKLKSKFKILLLVGMLLLTVVVFNTTIVNATDVTAEETEEVEEETVIEKIVNIIPEEIVIDSMTEKEAIQDNDKLKEAFNAEINAILKENNINLDELNLELSISSVYYSSINAKFGGQAKFTTTEGEFDTGTAYVDIKCSNSDKYDASYAEALNEKIENKIKSEDVVSEILYYNVSAGDLMGNESYFTTGGTKQRMEAMMASMLGDSSVEVYCTPRLGNSRNGVTSEAGVGVYFIHNNIVYGTYTYSTCYVPIVIVPNNIEDTEKAYIDYATNVFEKRYKDEEIISIERYTDEMIKYHDVGGQIVNNGSYYKMTMRCGETYEVLIAIKKADEVKIANNVTVNDNSGACISSTEITSSESIYTEMLELAKTLGYNNVFCTYEFEVVYGSIGNEITITFNLGSNYEGQSVMVLHKKSSGKYEQFEETVKDGKITIKVNELSPFMVATKTAGSTLGNDELDETPKTGIANYTTLAIALVMLSSLGIVVLKKD